MIRFIAALSVPAAAVALGLSAPAAAQTQCGDTYTVRSGDTLYGIAQQCGTSVDALVRANDAISNPNVVRVGWTIRVPNGEEVASNGNLQPVDRTAERTYRVQRGDTLYAVAERLGVSVAELLAENAGIDPNSLFVGQPIRLPGGDGDEGMMQVTGVITREGVECPALRASNGQLYTLAGETDPYGPGDRVRVQGTQPDMSICQQGTTIRVHDIERVS